MDSLADAEATKKKRVGPRVGQAAPSTILISIIILDFVRVPSGFIEAQLLILFLLY
jgi:hypothetical protein